MDNLCVLFYFRRTIKRALVIQDFLDYTNHIILKLILSKIMSFTYNPKKKKRRRTHGFLRRKKTKAGRQVIKRRRKKGRKRLNV